MAGLHERGQVTPKKLNPFSLERLWNKLKNISSSSDTLEHSIEVQADYGRRLASGDHLRIGGEVWRIVGITKGADGAPVVVSNGIKTESIASLALERIEEAAAHEDPAGPGSTPTSPPTPTGVPPRRPIATPSTSRSLPAPSGPQYGVNLGATAILDYTKSGENIRTDAADIELHAEKRAAGWWDKMFKYNWANEEYRQRGKARAAVRQASGDNITAAHDPEIGRAIHKKISDAEISRALRTEEEFLHSEGADGERKRSFGDTPEEAAVKAEYIELIREYAANPAMDKKALDTRKNAIFAKISKLSGDVMEGGKMFFHDLDRLAEQLRQHESAVHGMENLDIDLDIVVGRAKLGAKTEREKNLVDSALEKLHNKTGGILGYFENEIAIAAGVIVGGALFLKSAIVENTIGKVMTFGSAIAANGVYGWWKEKSRLRSEQALDAREKEMGAKPRSQETPEAMAAREVQLQRELAALPYFAWSERERVKSEIAVIRRNDTDQPRRKEMQEFELGMRSAKELTQMAHFFMHQNGVDANGNPKYELNEGISIAEATDVLAELEARKNISNREKKGMLSYTSLADHSVEKYAFDVACASLKAGLRARVDGDSSIDKSTYANFQAYYNEILRLRIDGLYGKESHAQKQQKKFARYVQEKARNRGITNVVISATVGWVLHDLWIWATDNIDHTTIAGVIHWFKDLFNHTPVPQTGIAGHLEIDGGTIMTPPGTELYPQADGSFTLESVSDHHVLVGGLQIDSHGHLIPDSVAKIEHLGGNVVRADGWTNSPVSADHTMSNPDWLNQPNHGVVEVHRSLWADENTLKIFELNEQEFEWGGIDGTGLDADGKIVMTAENMFKGGSFHDAVDIDVPAAIAEGKIHLLLSMNAGTQDRVVDIVSDSHGVFHISDMDPDVAKTFFHVDNHGQVIFDGYHAEVVYENGVDANGVHDVIVLATHKGGGLLQGITAITSGECIPNDITQVSLPPVHETTDIPLPWIVPIRGRTPLEPLTPGFETRPYYPNIPEENWEVLRADMSPRLRANPDAVLDPRTEMEWYFADMERRYPGYRNELDALDQQNRDEMSDDVEAVVALAVAGAGEQANIYRTLETYAHQQDRDGNGVWSDPKKKFEILLYVNWPKGSSAEKTLAEIERFRKGNPEVTVNIYTEELEPGRVEVGWIKRKVFDLALRRNLRRTGNRDILVVANDADTVYSSPNYLTDILEDMEKKPEPDVLVGRQDLDPEVYEKNPTFHVAMRFAQFIEAISRSKTGHIMTQGRNTILRGSSYAAVGGNRTRDFWADIEFGKLFTAARNGRKTSEFSNRDWVMVDPRREIDKFKSGELIAYTWSDFNERQNVRSGGRAEHTQPENIDVEALAAADENSALVREFRARIQEEINAFVDTAKKTFYYTGTGQLGFEGQQYIERALDFLGVEADITFTDGNVHVELKDTSKVRQRLLEYREENRKATKTKRNPLGPFIPATL